MSSIFELDNFDDFSEKINIDELYEKKRQHDLKKLEIFKKILNRIHVRIKTVSRQYNSEKCCWFVVPEFIIGVPKYDQGGCIAYIMDKLGENGFLVKYFHPNTLFITWSHWVPTYVRSEFKKKTGIEVDEYGKVIDNQEEIEDNIYQEQQQEITNNTEKKSKNGKLYTPINSYKPSGNLVYNNELLDKIEKKLG
jgi:hypothetical protein